ncbi:MAG TPA: ABC transporter permease [Chloroflexia bacterium]|nr:ABC transporter permease [Chloroflexia bacterium]
MATYLIRRILQTLLFIAVSIFLLYTLLMYIMPGGPARPDGRGLGLIGPGDYTYFGLDRPWPQSFGSWLFRPYDLMDVATTGVPAPEGIDVNIGDLRIRGSGALTGNFEVYSSFFRRPLGALLGGRWGNTTALVGAALVLAVVASLVLGVLAASKPRSTFDHLLTLFSFAGSSIPPFALGMLLILALAVFPVILRYRYNWEWLPALPPGGTNAIDRDDLLNRVYYMVLPVTTLALAQVVWLSRYVRAAMLEVLGEEYIRTALAKGVARRRVLLKHALRNAVIPFITAAGLAIPGLLSSSIVVETLFALNGIGQTYYVALGGCIPVPNVRECPPFGAGPDVPVALVLTCVFVVLVAFSNMLADLLHVAVDPRISYSSKLKL